MIVKSKKRRSLRRTISDLTPTKSLWKNMTSAVSVIKFGYGECYTPPEKLLNESEIKEFNIEGRYPRDSIVFGEIFSCTH